MSFPLCFPLRFSHILLFIPNSQSKQINLLQFALSFDLPLSVLAVARESRGWERGEVAARLMVLGSLVKQLHLHLRVKLNKELSATLTLSHCINY